MLGNFFIGLHLARSDRLAGVGLPVMTFFLGPAKTRAVTKVPEASLPAV